MIYFTTGALNHVEFRAATNPTWFVAEREGFEPSIPLLAEYTISNRAPSASRASLRNHLLKQNLEILNKSAMAPELASEAETSTIVT